MVDNPTRVALVGAGHIGRHHARILSGLPNAQLVAIADPRPGASDLAHEYHALWFDNHEMLLNACSVDAAIVAVPTHLHATVATSFLRSGISVLVEKPVASTIAESSAMNATAVDSGALLAVGHVERFNPMVSRLREIVQSGLIGTVSSIVARRVGGFPAREPSSDVVTDLAVHDIDIVSFVLGAPLALLSAHGRRTHHSQQLDSVQMLGVANDASAFIEANWVTPVKIRTIALTGSDGYVEGNYITQQLEWLQMDPISPQPDFEEFVRRFGAPRRRMEVMPMREPLMAQDQAFVDAVRTGDVGSLVDGPTAQTVLQIALAARDSIDGIDGSLA